ncbi:MAG: LegC family aminotransferase [Pseudorhodoplanes sp.]|nr:LegC family aminotransferase [Pseudorhodoplanes sp.]
MAVRHVVPAPRAALHEPEFRGREWDYVKSCIDDGWVSSGGAFVDRFERDLAAMLDMGFAVACANGTAALQVALEVAGVSPGDEVFVPALTFVATSNAVQHCGAIPHFVDCDEDSLGLDPQALKKHLGLVAVCRDGRTTNRDTGRRIKAIVPVHIFGHPARMTEICKIASEYGLSVVEDATEALGSRAGGRPVGSDGVMSVLSFNGNKIVTTGGGGAILTNDQEIARRARHVTTTAKLPHRWAFIHDQPGYNFRLPNINAALGCAQLERLPDFVGRKRRLAQAYAEVFRGNSDVTFLVERAGTQSNYWLNAILLRPGLEEQRDRILERLNDAGLQSRPAWTPMHQLSYQTGFPRADLPVTESICARLINLPSSPRLADGLAA